MSEVYAARSIAKKHIVEQCANCNLKKNNNGLYNHDNIVKVRETIKVKLNEVFLDHDTGLGMIKFLNNSNNAINLVKTNQMISADSVIMLGFYDLIPPQKTSSSGRRAHKIDWRRPTLLPPKPRSLMFVFSPPFFFCSFMRRNFIVALYGPR